MHFKCIAFISVVAHPTIAIKNFSKTKSNFYLFSFADQTGLKKCPIILQFIYNFSNLVKKGFSVQQFSVKRFFGSTVKCKKVFRFDSLIHIKNDFK